ncbi:MAG: MipA/OmpV family protein [Pseudomonadota bacterium]
MSIIRQLLIIALLHMVVHANADDSNVTCTRGVDCPSISPWSVSLAIGIGARQNPLVDGDHLPLVILPDIAYYSDRVYFDNGELGVFWSEGSNSQFSFFVAPNRERANFSFWHPSNILLPVEITFSRFDRIESQESVSFNEVDRRSWAFDAGVQWQWFWENTILRFSFMHDVSGVYEGANATLSLTHRWRSDSWRFQVTPELRWHSSELTNYYYGIREGEVEGRNIQFQGSGGLQPGITVMAIRPVFEDWNLLIRFGGTHLHSGMADSPLVDKNSVFHGFIGMAYTF